jgi:hypothetical protein
VGAAAGRAFQPLPPAPPPFRFADPAEAGRALETAGFKAVAHERRLCLWQMRNGANLLDLIYTWTPERVMGRDACARSPRACAAFL